MKRRVNKEASFSALCISSITVYSSWMPILPGDDGGGGGRARGGQDPK
jgi:hypothetical protein